jgi:ribosomal protein L24
MAKDKAAKGAPKKGDAVKIIAGEHAGKAGKLVHIRQATGSAHVNVDGEKTLVVGVKEIAAA